MSQNHAAFTKTPEEIENEERQIEFRPPTYTPFDENIQVDALTKELSKQIFTDIYN